MIIIAFTSVFAHAGSTRGAFHAFARLRLGVTGSEATMPAMIMVMLLIAGVTIESTVRWVIWTVGGMLLALAALRDLATWLPRRLGY